MAILTPSPETPTPDGELLRRFIADRDETAFELLVWRHSRLVFEVCRRVLRHRQDAEDAAQATFLVLARRAETVRTAVGGWLARVAFRCSVHMANRRRQVLLLSLPGGNGVGSEGVETDLDAELDRLPDRYRLPLVLCCLQGLSYDEAATQLNVKLGTLSGRLSRAKALLRDRLLARGITVPAAVFAAYLTDLPRGSALAPEVIRTIVTTAFAPIGTADRVATVANGVTRMLTLHSFARRSMVVLTVAIMMLIGTFAVKLLADEPKKPTPADPPRAKAKTDTELVQGNWVFDSAEQVGGSNGIHQAWNSVVTFDGEKLTVTKFQGFDWKTTFKLDPDKSPKQFDMTVNELSKKVMGFKDGTIKGIYRFDGEALEMCLAATPDDPRPTDFTTGPKLKQFRFTLKKKAKDFDPTKLDKFTMKVIDADGKPVEGAVVCQHFAVSTSETTITRQGGKPYLSVETKTMTTPPLPATDQEGETTYDTKAASNDAYRPNGVLYIRHEKRKLVALELISPARIMNGLTITLRPEAKLSGKVVCPDGVDAGPTSVYVCAHNIIWVLGYTSYKSEFEFIVPAGEYKLLARGEYLKEEFAPGASSYPSMGNTSTVAVGIEGKYLKLEVPASKMGALRGKAAPDLGEMAAWKGKEVKLADLKGKVVLVQFFTVGQNTNIVYSMPSLIEHHNHYGKKGLVVVGVHYPSAFGEPIDTVKKLDEQFAAIRTAEWPKGDIPFPIGLMKKQDGPTTKAYGIESSPILIDKKGKVIGLHNPYSEADLTRLEKLLDEK